MQGLDKVIDCTYVPSTDEEMERFQEMQDFVYDVLLAKVLSSQERSIILKHLPTWDTRQAYQDFLALHNESVIASTVDNNPNSLPKLLQNLWT